MRIGVGSGFAIVTGATIVSVVIIATLGATFIRETSGIEERWGTRTMAERDTDITNPAGELDTPDETTPAVSPKVTGRGDHANDGIENSKENNSGIYNGLDDPGTDPTNPDTDGDGVADGIEIILGTDPTDLNSGGLPVVTQPGQEEPVSGLKFTYSISKQVRLAPDGSYTHYVDALADGQTQVDFKIEVSVSVSNVPDSASGDQVVAVFVVDDLLPRGLNHIQGSDSLTVGQTGQPQLIGSGWMGEYRIELTHNNPTASLTFAFSATVEEAGLWENVARVRLENFPIEGALDKAIVLGKALPTS